MKRGKQHMDLNGESLAAISPGYAGLSLAVELGIHPVVMGFDANPTPAAEPQLCGVDRLERGSSAVRHAQ